MGLTRGWTCGCTFDPSSVEPRFSPEWHRAHRDRHLSDFPNADQQTRDNLATLIVIASRNVSQRASG